MNTLLRACIAVAVWSAFIFPTHAQQYPSRQISIVVPYPPSGQHDLVARMLAGSMEKRLRVPVVVDNRPGAGSAIGSALVAKAQPDGYTLLVTGSSVGQLHLLQANITFDPVKDLIPVSYLVSGMTVFVTNKQTGVKTWKDFVAYANRNAGKVNYASAGRSSILIAFEALKDAARMNLSEIPYKGQGEYLPALLSNDVQLIMGTTGTFKQYIDKGDMVPLLVIGDRKEPGYPSVPTTEELGYGEAVRPFASTLLMAPGGTPRQIVDRLSAEVAFFVSQPDIIKRAADINTEMVGSTPAVARKTYDGDIAAWTKVAKSINLRPQ